MNYKLALSLKDAGFPQMDADNTRFIMPKDILWQNELDGPICINSNQIWNEDNYSEQDCAYLPSLEELIEACGNKLVSIHKWENSYSVIGITGNSKFVDGKQEYGGSTLIEAVAHFWFALNAK